MNKLIKFRILALITILVIGCNKENDNSPSVIEHPDWLVIGEVTPYIKVTDIVPDTSIIADWNEHKNYFVDLEKDEMVDINIRAYTDYTMGGMVLSSGGVKLNPIDSETFIASDSTYALAFFKGDTLKIDDKWYSGESIMMTYGSGSSIPPGPYIYRGNWVEGENKYLGIRKNNRLGWIKIDVNKASFTLYEFAIQE